MPPLRITPSPTERTTAATDVLLAAQSLIAVVYLAYLPAAHPWKAWLWIINFSLLALAALLGAIVHGLDLPRWLWLGLWGAVYLLLGQVVGLFSVGAVFDLWGPAAAQTALPSLVGLGLIFFVFVMARSAAFFVFVVYQAVAMMFALLAYLWLALSGGLPGAGWMVAGIVTTLAAAVMQASRRGNFTLIWQFDHNSAYHLVQLAGVALLVLGLVNSEL